MNEGKQCRCLWYGHGFLEVRVTVAGCPQHDPTWTAEAILGKRIEKPEDES